MFYVKNSWILSLFSHHWVLFFSFCTIFKHWSENSMKSGSCMASFMASRLLSALSMERNNRLRCGLQSSSLSSFDWPVIRKRETQHFIFALKRRRQRWDWMSTQELQPLQRHLVSNVIFSQEALSSPGLCGQSIHSTLTHTFNICRYSTLHITSV